MSIISAGTSVGTSLVSTGDTTGNLVFRTGPSATTALTLSGTDQSATFAGAVSFSSNAFALGSASAPSITFTGDTNTGIFSPGADTIAFSEGGVEAMRLDSSGGVQIGRTSVIGTNNRLAIQMFGTTASGYTAASNAALAIDAGTATNSVLNLVGGGELGIYRSNSSGAFDVGIGFGDNSNRILRFDTAGSERLRIAAAGQIGIGGANYGSSGQVLTSGGSGAAPSWTTISSTPTTAQVLSATAGATAGAVGTYCIAYTESATNLNATRAGSDLRGFSLGDSGFNPSFSGTWRNMGATQPNQSATLSQFLRIS